MNEQGTFHAPVEKNKIAKELEEVFAFRNGMGGLRGYSQEGYYSQRDWLLRARFLLSEVDDEVIAHMMNLASEIKIENHFLAGTVSWICGLLKKREYIPQLKKFMLQERDFFNQPIYFIALLLYEDHSLADCFEEYIDKYSANNKSLLLAKSCLELLSNEKRNVEWNKLPHMLIADGQNRFWKELIRRSVLLRSGIPVEDGFVFQHQLRSLIDRTATPEQHLLGLLQHNSQKATTAKTNEVASLLQLLESDVYHQISGEKLVSIFEKVLDAFPRSIPILERCSYSLLLSGNENDVLAKQLWQEAQMLKEEIWQFEDEHIICPMYKAPTEKNPL